VFHPVTVAGQWSGHIFAGSGRAEAQAAVFVLQCWEPTENEHGECRGEVQQWSFNFAEQKNGMPGF